MKEFVEKLIGRLEEKSFRYFNEGYGSESVIKKNSAISIISQLAKEYNNEVCEWSKQGGYNFYLHKTSCGTEDTFDDSYVFCPYCGKKIKVVK